MTFAISDLPEVLRANLSRPSASRSTAPTTQHDLAIGDAESASDGEFFDAVNAEEAIELYTVVRNLCPENTAEIGFCCAGSGLAILKALQDNDRGMHHVCDPYQSTYARNRGVRNVERAGLTHRLDFHEKFPEDVFSTLPALQFVFIDASHLFDLSMLDFVLADKRLEVGGVIAFHDLWMPSLQKLFRYVISNRGYEIYRPLGIAPAMGRGARDRLLRTISQMIRRVPRANRIFSPELITDWTSYGIGNVAYVRKIANDGRDFRHHEVF